MSEIKIIDRASNPTFEYEGKTEQVHGRWYFTDNGLWMPSVTTILNVVSGYSPKSGENFADVGEKLAKRKAEGKGKLLSEYRDEAAKRGTAIHAACEAVDKGSTDLSAVDPNIRKDIEAYAAWVKTQPKRTVKQTELFCFSATGGWAGQLDCLSYDEEQQKYKIEDKKSGRKVKVYSGWQLAAYAMAAEEMGLIATAYNCLLEIQQIREGNVKVFKYAHFDWLRDSFVACLRVWKALNWNWGLYKLYLSGRYPWLKNDTEPQIAAETA